MGFLYAIAHGANLIYDTDDDNVPLESLDNYNHDKEDIVKIKTDQNTVNIYKMFSNGSSIWPRGFPLENINNKVGFLTILSSVIRTKISRSRGNPGLQGYQNSRSRADKISLLFQPDLSCCHHPEDNSVLVRQYLAQQDPDVDAIYRLTDKLPFYFQKNGGWRGYSLPVGTFVPYNAQATMHSYQVEIF